MKKNSTLLFLLLNFICQAQKPSGVLDMNVKLEAMYYPKVIENNYTSSFSIKEPISDSPILGKTNAPILSSVFYRLTGSHDMLGTLVSHSKPLQYNYFLQAYSFITRKNPSYVPSSNGNAGTIVGYIGKNNASTNNLSSWDSTCLWTNTLNIAQKAVGGLWNPGGFTNSNTDVNKATFVASGSTKTGTAITGSFRASKSVSVTPKNSPTDMQYFSNTAPFSSPSSTQMTKHDEPDFSFISTVSGPWLNGMIYNDINGNDEVTRGLRGMHLSKGTFLAGTMVWTSDSIIPPTELKTNGAKVLWRQPYLAFSSDGIHGCAMFIGLRQGTPLNIANRGMQPIIYRTTNGGASWALVNGIDFVNPTSTKAYVLNSLDVVGATTVKAPYFNPIEGIDMTIDYNGKIHILTTVCGTAKSHNDSLSYIHQYNVSGETYSWPHTDGKRPYILDFYGDGTTGWDCKIIDSLDTECPSNYLGGPGFTVNPWAYNSQSVPISSSARLQLSRTVCGNILLYSWAEADTNLTTANRKFNEFPNIKIRSRRICDDALSPDEFSITSLPTTLNAVKDKAYFHHMSSEMNGALTAANSATALVGITVSRNSNNDATMPTNHYFSSTALHFNYPSAACGWPPSWQQSNCFWTNINQVSEIKTEIDAYPVPTLKELTIEFPSSQNNSFQYCITDLAGKIIRTGELQGNQKTSLNVQELTAGVYILSIRDGERSVGVKKFVKQ